MKRLGWGSRFQKRRVLTTDSDKLQTDESEAAAMVRRKNTGGKYFPVIPAAQETRGAFTLVKLRGTRTVGFPPSFAFRIRVQSQGAGARTAV
jgi:hypothetical protein